MVKLSKNKGISVITLVTASIIIAIIASGISVYATAQYYATQVEYKDGKSVAEALNELYANKNDVSEDTQDIEDFTPEITSRYPKTISVKVPELEVKNDAIISGYMYFLEDKVIELSKSDTYTFQNLEAETEYNIKIAAVTQDNKMKISNNMKASTSKLYMDLEYITINSGNYINTGIVPSNHTTEIKFNFNTYNNDEHLFGTSSGAYYYQFTAWSNSYHWGNSGSGTQNGTWSTGIHTLIYNGANNAVTLDNTSLGSGTNINSSTELVIGKRDNSANLTATIYYIKITNKANGELVRDFVPVKNGLTNAVGLYDKVTNTFYGNNGSGSITAGPLK